MAIPRENFWLSVAFQAGFYLQQFNEDTMPRDEVRRIGHVIGASMDALAPPEPPPAARFDLASKLEVDPEVFKDPKGWSEKEAKKAIDELLDKKTKDTPQTVKVRRKRK